MTEKRLKLCSENYGMAFWLFYMIVPFLMKRTSFVPLFMDLVIVLLAGYLIVMFEVYRACFTTGKFLFDAACMVAGLSLFYWLSFRMGPSSAGFDLTLYLGVAFTYLPTAFRLESRRRRLPARG